MINQKEINKEISTILDKGFDRLDLNTLDYHTIIDLINYSSVDDLSLIKSLSYILLLLFSTLKDGSLCLKLNPDITPDKLNLLIDNNENPKEIINQFINNTDKFKNILTYDVTEYKPVIIIKKERSLILYFEKYFNYEKKLKKEIARLLENNLEYNINQKIINEIKQSNLNDKQKIAVFLSLFKNFVIISGGPGTGKTFIISFLLKSLLQNGIDPDRIKIATPTGKSAERLITSIKLNLENENKKTKESLLKIEGETIHRLLKYSSIKNDFIYNEKNKLPADVIIIDEVSMVDVVLMSKLLSSLTNDARIIFLGDKDQLPSIEAGSVLAELIPNDIKESFSEKVKIITDEYNLTNGNKKMTDRIIILKENYRSNNIINKFANKINMQEKTFVEIMPRSSIKSLPIITEIKENFLFIENIKDNLNDFRNMIEQFIETYYFNLQSNYQKTIQYISNKELNNENKFKLKNSFDELYNYITNLKILTTLKEGPYGSNKINLFIKETFREKNNRYFKDLFPGLPIVITQNDYSLKLFNGDTGIILADKAGILKVIFKKFDDYIILPLDILHSFELAFAITIHKSQGSEYNEIIIILPDDENNPLLTKEILYTGITRAKNKVFIYGKKIVFKKAISNKIMRESGINLWE